MEKHTPPAAFPKTLEIHVSTPWVKLSGCRRLQKPGPAAMRSFCEGKAGERRLLLQRPEHEVGTFHYPDPRQDGKMKISLFETPARLRRSAEIIGGREDAGGCEELCGEPGK